MTQINAMTNRPRVQTFSFPPQTSIGGDSPRSYYVKAGPGPSPRLLIGGSVRPVTMSGQSLLAPSRPKVSRSYQTGGQSTSLQRTAAPLMKQAGSAQSISEASAQQSASGDDSLLSDFPKSIKKSIESLVVWLVERVIRRLFEEAWGNSREKNTSVMQPAAGAAAPVLDGGTTAAGSTVYHCLAPGPLAIDNTLAGSGAEQGEGTHRPGTLVVQPRESLGQRLTDVFVDQGANLFQDLVGGARDWISDTLGIGSVSMLPVPVEPILPE